jgi:bifunctional DNA-binding transcriptional regulator/antitoxin component of YhaV-PrlF toxin-antitoxin module
MRNVKSAHLKRKPGMQTLTMAPQVQRVLSGGRITINEEARQSLNIDSGDYVIVKVEDGVLKVIPAKISPRTREAKK